MVQFFYSAIFLITISQANGFNLEYIFDTSTGWSFVPRSNMCLVQNLVVTTRNKTVTAINGMPASYYQSHDIKMLKIERQTMNFFPSGIGSFFKNLEGIYVQNCNLKFISSSDLEPFKDLKELWIKGNQLEVLHNDLLQNNPELRMVSFEDNELKSIGEFLFENSTKLEEVHFGIGNSCTTKNERDKSFIHEYKSEFRSKCHFNLEYYMSEIDNLRSQMKLLDDEIADLKSKLTFMKAKKFCGDRLVLDYEKT